MKKYNTYLNENLNIKTKNFIPTYEDCVEITKSKGDVVFYEQKYNIEGYKVSVFNYRIAQYTDFIEPVKGKTIDAKELRGITFVFNKDGSLYKRYLMLKKFWNVGQVTETQYNVLKDLKIKAVYNKEDGSLITFIRLPDGKIISKTKAGFNNDQCIAVEKIYNTSENIKNFINYCFDNDLSPMFEYVSFANKIVLDYPETKLILLRVRNNKTGIYLDIEDFRKKYAIDIVKKEEIENLDTLIELSKTIKGIEGWVIEFENGLMVKQKSAEYFHKHRLKENIERENDIIAMILDETIDDVISQLDEKDKEKLEYINNISDIVNDEVTNRINDVNELVKKYSGNIKDFAVRYSKTKNFGLAIQVIKGNDIYETVKEFILKHTKHLVEARNFIKNKGFKNK
jgi:T4 RnlA family RNA ligase